MRSIVLVCVLAAALGATGSATAPASTGAGPYRNGLVAFVRCCGPETGIYVIRPDGSGEQRVFAPVSDDAPLEPAWSPDGRRLAFVPGAPRRGVWTMRANGRDLRRVTPGRGDPAFPSFGPGGWLVFSDAGHRRTGNHDLYAVRGDGSGLTRLTRTSANEVAAAWSPNGREIVYWRGRDLWRMRADGRAQRLLARNASAPSFSPAGTHVAFVRGGDPWVMKSDGSGARRVAHLQEPQEAVAWSPDGRWLVTAPAVRGDLLLLRADGSQTRPLTGRSGYGHSWPAWQRLSR